MFYLLMLFSGACLQTFKAAKMPEIEGEVAEFLKHAPNKRGGPKKLRVFIHAIQYI